MANCIHNQLESLGKRYLIATPRPQRNKVDIRLLLKITKYVSDKIKEFYQPEFDFKTYVRNKPGAVRKRFLRAYGEMLRGQTNIGKNSRISAFVKNERYFEEGKSPRMIMGRDPKFNIIYARFIARLEDAFFKLPQVANACDYAKCGDKFSDLFNRCSSMFENDMSKFEATQRQLLITLEYMVYREVLTCLSPSEIDAFDTVFASKCVKPVVTGAGVKAAFMWCRGSGDLDTSVGNGIINYITTMYFMITNFCPNGVNCDFDACGCYFDSFVLKGDDSYGCAPHSKLENVYAWFGLDAKLIYRADARDVEFCSGHFIRMQSGKWYYVQKLRKLVTSVSTCINSDIIKNGWLGHYLKSLGMMYKVLYRDVPVYEDFADMLCTVNIKSGININLIEGVSYGAWEAFKNKGNTEQVVSCPETLLDIANSNDMPFAQIESLIQTFRNANLVLPQHLIRKCNVKNKPDKTECDLGEIISTWVNKIELDVKVAKIRRKLRTCFYQPYKEISALFNIDKD